jgi:hypothetical protein
MARSLYISISIYISISTSLYLSIHVSISLSLYPPSIVTVITIAADNTRDHQTLPSTTITFFYLVATLIIAAII